MLCKILIINMLDYKFKRFIFNIKLKLTSYMQRISDFQSENKFFIETVLENCDSC